MDLSKEQQDIVNNCDQNLYIAAGPGSGKSTTLSKICEKLLSINPLNKILLLTFTNKAASSIISKCEHLDKDRVWGSTFHSVAYKLLKNNGFTNSICDEYKKNLIIKKIFHCKKDKTLFSDIYDEINKKKSEYPLDTSNKYISQYQKELDRYNLMDFDDIIYNFITNASSINLPDWSHILIDELQDTSKTQLEMLKKLEDGTKATMLGVADDAQSIYRWRGARPENVKDFINIFNCKIFPMGGNFRSDIKIVEASNKLIANDKECIKKDLHAIKKEQGIVHAKQHNSWMDEINYITSLCKKYQDKKIAILYRNRTHKNHLEFELKKKNIKYIVNDFLEITDRSAIKSILSILKIVSHHFDEYDLFQAAKVLKKLGNKTIVNLIDRTKKNNTSLFSQYMLDILDDKLCKRFQSLTELTDFYNRNENSPLNFLVSEIEKYFIPSFDYQKDMRDFILDITKDYKIEYTSIFELCNELGLNGKKENEDKDANIELSTVHGFKGNQAHTTIVPWVHQYQEIKDKEYNINDERRLFYVAITRAESSLYISYSGLKPRFVKEMGL